MSHRRSVLLTLLLLLTLLVSSGASVAAPLGDQPVHSFKVAAPRAGFASLARAGAENFMTLAGGSADSPLGRVNARERFRLYSEYEAVFFPTAAGSATFELTVALVRENGSRERLGHNQATVAGIGPKRKSGALSVGVGFNSPGVYKLAVSSRTAAYTMASSGPVVDEDEIIVFVVVLAARSATQERVRNVEPAAQDHKEALALPDSSADLPRTPPATPVHTIPTPVPESGSTPTDRQLLVASPRGHLLTPSVMAAENFDQGNSQWLTVRLGYTLTFESAYEFVWFAGAEGRAYSELSVRIASTSSVSPTVGETAQVDLTGGPQARRELGLLRVPVTFNAPGRYALAAHIRTRVSPLEALNTITQDEDIVSILVTVVGEPQTAAITGTVTADDTGAPLEGVVVQVFGAPTGRSRAMVRTGADGSYVATGLTPGKYLVWANPVNQNYLPEWYDDSPTRAEADPVTVVASETTGEINLALTPGSVISGRITEDTGTAAVTVPISNVLVSVGLYDGNTILARTRSLQDGSYRVEKLPQGTYWVHAGDAARALIEEYYDDKLTREEATPVTVTVGTEVSGIDFALSYGGGISGRVVGISPSTDPLSVFKVTAYGWDSGRAVRTVEATPRGAYLIPSLPEGRYRVYAFDQAGRFVAEYYDNVTDPAQATPVVVTRRAITPNINFELAYAGVALVEVRPLVSQVNPGDTFTVTVEVNRVTDLGNFEFRIAFAPAILQAQGVELGGFWGSTGRQVTAVGPAIDNTAGTLTYGAFSLGDEQGPSGSGTLAVITFTAAFSGESPLNLSNVRLVNTQARPLDARTQGARVQVGGQCIFGDLDCDCDVDVADVMQVARRWGARRGDPEYDARYDLDHDGDIDIVDVAMVASAWGNTCPEATAARVTVQGAGPKAKALSTGLRLDPATTTAAVGQPVTLRVLIDEALDVGSFEFTLTYDATRLTVQAGGVSLGDFLGSSGRSATAMSPQITVENGVGRLRYGAYTLGPTPPGSSGSGALAEITFTPIAAGSAQVAFANAQLTDTTGESQSSLALQGATLSISAGTTLTLPHLQR